MFSRLIDAVKQIVQKLLEIFAIVKAEKQDLTDLKNSGVLNEVKSEINKNDSGDAGV